MTRPVVVGAGPAGLTTALLLASRNIACTIVDGRDKPRVESPSDPPSLTFRDGSRAVVTQRSSLHTWDQADPRIAERLRMVGVTWQRKETYWGSRLLYRDEYASADQGHPPFVNVPQPTVLQVLLDSARAFGDLIEWKWGIRVVAARQDDEKVTLTTSDGPLTAPWVVAADGATSTVRAAVGISMPRHASRHTFVIADVRDDDGLFPFDPLARRFYFNPPTDRAGQLLVMPQPGGVWRLDWQSPTNLDLDEERSSGRLDSRLTRTVGTDRHTIEWVSQYRFENSVADTFQRGRVLLVGDAAHRLSPFGGRGMNSGVEDARAVANALTQVLRGADASPIKEYADVRRRAAVTNVTATAAALRVMEPRGPLDVARRTGALVTAPWLPAARRYIDSGPYIADTSITTTTSR